MNSWYVAPSKVLVAEDDGDLLAVIGFALHNAGFEAIKVANGNDALLAFAEQTFALLVLDINMPELNGLQVCTRVRERSSVPVLMLSARDQERDLLQALDAGADAYMVKPFSPRALIAHIRALLRRSSLSEANGLQVGSVKLDVEGRLLRLPSAEIRLTKLEARLLQLLMLNAGQTVSTKNLIAEVWNTYSTANRNMLKQVVFRLRRKLALDAAAGQALQTIPDGYVWNSEASATANSASVPATAATATAFNC
jgi:DNA-binding response OmpR family regulator